MSQKELNYLEDIYNHETLVMNIMQNMCDEYDDERYSPLFKECLNTHESLNKRVLKLLEGGK